MKQLLRYCFFCFLFLAANLSLKAQVDGKFYSQVYYGGAAACYCGGTLNMYDPLTNFDTAVMNLNSSSGWRPYGNFIQLHDGLLYAMYSYGGGGGNGNIHRYNPQTNQDTVLFTFPGSGIDGALNYSTLCHASNDSLYAVTYEGGTFGNGTLFSFNYHTDSFKLLINLSASTLGGYPTGSLIQASDSLLYGLTTYYNSNFNGTLYSYNIKTGVSTLLHTFTGTPDGGYPQGNLLQVGDSLLYGLTVNGGANGDGCIFSFNILTHTEKVLWSFAGSPDGANPGRSLLLASDGNLYSTTIRGGASGVGTLFKYNIATNTETVLHSFANTPDGANPYADIIQATDGLLYGSTGAGGAINQGAIFSYNITSSAYTMLQSYDSTDGFQPNADFLEVMSAAVIAVGNICANDMNGSLAINVRGGKAPFTYTWSTGATTSSISNLLSGIYTCAVTDARGIQFSFQDTVQPLPTAVNFTVSNACTGDSNGSAIAVISGGTKPFSYIWNNGNTTDTASNLPQGPYTFTVTDAHGCTASASVTISQAAPLVINSIIATEQTYPGNNGSIFVSVSGGIPPGDSICYHYLWSVSGYYTGYDTTTLTGLDSGIYSVCVTSCYCSGSFCDTGIHVATGIKNISNANNLVKVYPVPSSGLITVALNGSGFENLQITDALGMQVYKETLSPKESNNTLNINLSNLSDGVYILQVNSRQDLLTRKIIIQK